MAFPSLTNSSILQSATTHMEAMLQILPIVPIARPTNVSPRTNDGRVLKWECITSRLHQSCNAIIHIPNRPDDATSDSVEALLAQDETRTNGTYTYEELVIDKYEHKNVDLDRIKNLADSVRRMLKTMDDGRISISPYDTAWVALVEDLNGSGGPQFPSSLEWISSNQLPDGSWGDKDTFLAYDRIINTLACVVALKSWNMHPGKCERGISFVRHNIPKLENEKEDHMPIGFEIALPSVIEVAKNLGIDLPNDSPSLQRIHDKRNVKLMRIPTDMLHSVPTTLLYTLEGMPGLDWQKLLNLQSNNGSFFFSPSSTAFALQQTKDAKCLEYLDQIVKKFNGGAPVTYPVDLFEHLWAVDRLQRLGISRYFQTEIDDCINYVHRHWTSEGISWGRDSRVMDIDDTAMGFRLMRLQGYHVSTDVFKHFEKDGEFFCFVGQSNQAVTGMYNMYRASQVMFPAEVILTNARKFTGMFLQEKRLHNELVDKWIISKDLPGEVGYALDLPWYASLHRVETRFYLEQYGGEDDVWIGKTLYRMPYVNNNTYLELAKLDYNNCQTLHQQEWKSIQKWYKSSNVGESGLSGRRLLLAYYLAAASLFEPEKSAERLSWAKTTILTEMIMSFSDKQQLLREQKHAFVKEFERSSNRGRYGTRDTCVRTLHRTLNQLSLDVLTTQGRDIHLQLHHAWFKWLESWEEGSDMGQADAELSVNTLNLCCRSDQLVSSEILMSHPKYDQLLEATNSACSKLRLFQQHKVHKTDKCLTDSDEGITTDEIESDMQHLVKLVVTKCEHDLPSNIKQNFLNVARSFYYAAYCNTETINFHIAKVLFERVI